MLKLAWLNREVNDLEERYQSAKKEVDLLLTCVFIGTIIQNEN